MELNRDDPSVKSVWRFMVQTEELSDSSWRAWYPGGEWSVTATTEHEAEEKAIEEAIRRREDPDEAARKAAATHHGPVESENDDPRRKGVWRFTPQTEELSDGTWRAWFPSGGWSVTGATEDDARDKAGREWFRRREDPNEVARRLAMMRRHLVEPVPGVEMFDRSVLNPAWESDNPAQTVRRILDQLGDESPRG